MGAFPLPAVVSAEAGSVVSRHGNDVAAAQLGGEISGSGAGERPPRKMVGGRGGVGRSGRLSQRPVAARTGELALGRNEPLQARKAAGCPAAPEMCETRTKDHGVG